MSRARFDRFKLPLPALVASCVLSLLAFVPIARADQASERAEQMIAGMHEAFGDLGEMVGGLSPEQQKKADALEKKMAAKLRADPSQAGDAFKQEVIKQFRTILRPEQQKKLDAQMQASNARMASVQTSAHLRQIGLGCIMYSNENKGALPPDLGAILVYVGGDPSVFLIGQSSTAVPPDLGKSDAKAQAAWVNQNAEFIYIKPGKKLADIPAGTVLSYVKPAAAAAGNSFLRSDGSVVSLDAEKSAKVLADLKAGKNPPPSLKDE